MTLRTTALVVLALAAAACGSSKHAGTTGASTSASTPAPAQTQAATRTATTQTAARTASTLTAPPPVPAGVPPAPDGLTQTVGYGTYELCASGCSAAVPASIRRPLHVPTSGCSVSAGSGPVRPQGSATQLPVTPFVGSSWQAGRVTWQASGYSGPILIRGREVGGPHAIGFGEGHVPYDELQLKGAAMGVPPGMFPSFTRVRSRGCYAYQVDGTSFSEVIVFKAT
jgi:hypothetical protein